MRKVYMVVAVAMLLGGCIKHTEKCEDSVGDYQLCHHKITYDTHPACVGTCK